MAASKGDLRTCGKGHNYYKSSDCPTCPVCEQERKPDEGFLALLSAPARRALEHNGITSLQQLAKYSEKEILQFHGMGPGSLPKLRTALQENGLSFKNEHLHGMKADLSE
ncbi:RNA polymerase alpha subunit C-terminal domain-containing protein [Paenibacillus harenae]|uniref:RNA polymerase alpha subunit C-terminal domain-containing protein n=1 Tax=Paenibacillus harenae TaxID=306543 RepID=UPI00040C9E71|nr:RNA polymerase alpha subunit C-terminal domain-containing protein [Paenibacillus harenae]